MTRQETQALAASVRAEAAGRESIRIMEVCGTHTVSLFRSGVRSLLPPNVRLISGPGCPVCVTAQGYIDAACELASLQGVTVCTYGDMVRVPGGRGSLAEVRARGGQVRVVYSVRDALRLASQEPAREVVFLAVGFETTAPATAAAVREAERRDAKNFSVLLGHKLVVPAMMALLAAGDVPIDGFLCPGHVSVIIGAEAYQPVVAHHGRPCVVAGFEPSQMLDGILAIVRQVARGEARLENVYGAAVTAGGNETAQALLGSVFRPAEARWRAMGTIPHSGLELQDCYRAFDARRRFQLDTGEDHDPPGCRCGEVIQGRVEPAECTLFGRECTPAIPVGPCMVSSEGTCAAWYKYGDHRGGLSQ